MSAGVWLRRALPSDAEALAALEQAASLHPWSLAQVRAELERRAPDEVLLLAGRQGPVAYCATRLVLDEAQVMNLATAPQLRRLGLARFLLGVALARAARAGAVRALLEVRAGNTAAQRLYAEFGFQTIGRRRGYYREPMDDALVLERGLGPILN